MRSTILQFLLVLCVVFSVSTTAYSQNGTDTAKDQEAIKSMLAKYKSYIEKGDAENLLKIITSESKKKLEKELEKVKEFVKDIPRDKQDEEISAFGKTPREITAMDVTSFLKWALSRLGKFDIQDMKETVLTEIKFSNDGKKATLSWKGENTVEAPKTVVKEDGSWKIELTLS